MLSEIHQALEVKYLTVSVMCEAPHTWDSKSKLKETAGSREAGSAGGKRGSGEGQRCSGCQFLKKKVVGMQCRRVFHQNVQIN